MRQRAGLLPRRKLILAAIGSMPETAGWGRAPSKESASTETPRRFACFETSSRVPLVGAEGAGVAARGVIQMICPDVKSTMRPAIAAWKRTSGRVCPALGTKKTGIFAAFSAGAKVPLFRFAAPAGKGAARTTEQTAAARRARDLGGMRG